MEQETIVQAEEVVETPIDETVETPLVEEVVEATEPVVQDNTCTSCEG